MKAFGNGVRLQEILLSPRDTTDWLPIAESGCLMRYRKNSSILLMKSWLTCLVVSFFFFSQCLTSLNLEGFSKGLEMELPSTKLPSLADPQVQGPSLNALCDCDTPPEAVPSYSLTLGRAPSEQSHGAAAGPTPGDALLGSTKCKVGIARPPLLERTPVPLTASYC